MANRGLSARRAQTERIPLRVARQGRPGHRLPLVRWDRTVVRPSRGGTTLAGLPSFGGKPRVIDSGQPPTQSYGFILPLFPDGFRLFSPHGRDPLFSDEARRNLSLRLSRLHARENRGCPNRPHRNQSALRNDQEDNVRKSRSQRVRGVADCVSWPSPTPLLKATSWHTSVILAWATTELAA
jgi:hypothetical protein